MTAPLSVSSSALFFLYMYAAPPKTPAPTTPPTTPPMRAPLSDSSSSADSSAGVGAGVIVTISVFDVTVAASGTISLTTTVRPDAASFSTKAVLKAAAKDDDFVGSASVSWTAVASASDVVTSSYSTFSFAPCNSLASPCDNLRVTTVIFVMVTFDGSTPNPTAMEAPTLDTKVVSAASDSAVTFSGRLPKSKVSADFTVYVVISSKRVVVAPTAVVSSGAAVVGSSGSHVG